MYQDDDFIAISTSRSNTKLHNNMILNLEQATNRSATIASRHGLTECFIGTINFRDDAETPSNAFAVIRHALRQVLGGRPFLMAGIIVPAFRSGSGHDRQHHAHVFVFLPPGAETQAAIDEATAARNSGVPRSYQIRRPDDAKGGIHGWGKYMGGYRNARHGGARVFQSEDAKNGNSTAVRREIRASAKGLGSVRLLGAFQGGAAAQTSPIQSDPDPDRCLAIIAEEHASVVTAIPEGQTAASADAPVVLDQPALTTTTTTTTTDVPVVEVILVQTDLFGPPPVNPAVLSSWRGGVMPADLRHAAAYVLRSTGVGHAALARRVGISRPQITNVIHGRFGASPVVADRLKAFFVEALAA